MNYPLKMMSLFTVKRSPLLQRRIKKKFPYMMLSIVSTVEVVKRDEKSELAVREISLLSHSPKNRHHNDSIPRWILLSYHTLTIN